MGAECSSSFNDYVSSPQYSNIATRMLGEDTFAYAPAGRNSSSGHLGAAVTNASLERAISRLSRLPFIGIAEAPLASLLLLATTFAASSHTDCLALWRRLQRAIAKPTRPGFVTAEQRAPFLAARRHLVEFHNTLDLVLYAHARRLFCAHWHASIEGACMQEALRGLEGDDPDGEITRSTACVCHGKCPAAKAKAVVKATAKAAAKAAEKAAAAKAAKAAAKAQPLPRSRKAGGASAGTAGGRRPSTRVATNDYSLSAWQRHRALFEVYAGAGVALLAAVLWLRRSAPWCL
jgi:hypothetical protein